MDRTRKKERRQVRFAEEVEIFYVNEDHSSTWSATIPVARENREKRPIFGRTRIDGPYYTTQPANEEPLESLQPEHSRGSLLHLELNMVPFVGRATQGFEACSSHHPRTRRANMRREQCNRSSYTNPLSTRVAAYLHERISESVPSASSSRDPSTDNEYNGPQSFITTSIQNGNPAISRLPSPDEVPKPPGSRLTKYVHCMNKEKK